MTSFSAYEEVLAMGREYEAAKQAMYEAQSKIRDWAYEWPGDALRIGLITINYNKASKLRIPR